MKSITTPGLAFTDLAARAAGWRPGPRALGAMAVLLFALTVPMTRLAGGTAIAPQLPPLFVAAGRGALAGVLAALYLWWVKAPRPRGAQWKGLAAVVGGAVLVFPIGMGWAVREVPAAHAAVVIGMLPLGTAALASWWMGRRPSARFWCAGVAGAFMVMAYTWRQARLHGADGWVPADGWLLVAVAGAAVAYAQGARLSLQLSGAHVISWALVLALPVTLPLAWWWRPEIAVPSASWWAFGYVALVSTWLGFFAWYAALARDPMRVSQLQLMQPFLSMTMAVPLLGEVLDPATVTTAMAVLLTVLLAQRAEHRPRR